MPVENKEPKASKIYLSVYSHVKDVTNVLQCAVQGTVCLFVCIYLYCTYQIIYQCMYV